MTRITIAREANQMKMSQLTGEIAWLSLRKTLAE